MKAYNITRRYKEFVLKKLTMKLCVCVTRRLYMILNDKQVEVPPSKIKIQKLFCKNKQKGQCRNYNKTHKFDDVCVCVGLVCM